MPRCTSDPARIVHFLIIVPHVRGRGHDHVYLDPTIRRLKKSTDRHGWAAAFVRTLVKTRIPPWHKIGPTVVDAIFEALAATELFDCFVISSMEENLIYQYEKLGHEDRNVSAIRAKISGSFAKQDFKNSPSLIRR